MVSIKYQIILLVILISAVALVEIVADKLHGTAAYQFNASWIGIDDVSEVIYARQELKIQGHLEKAVLTVEAFDDFEVWINGNKVGGELSPDTFMSGRYSIQRHLNSGSNIIGIKSASHRKGQPVMFRAELKYQDTLGLEYLTTDQTWQVANVWEPKNSKDNASWSQNFVKTTKWRTPKLMLNTGPKRPKPLGLPEYIDVFNTQGHWFWPNLNTPHSAQLTRIFNLDLKAKMTLGVAVNGFYTIYVNQKKVESLHASEQVIDLIDITPYIVPGENLVELAVYSEEIVPRLAVVGYLGEENRLLDLSSPQLWLYKSPELVFESIADNFPTLTYKRPSDYLKYTAVLTVHWFKNILILLLVIGFIYVLHKSTPKASSANFTQWLNLIFIIFMLVWFALLVMTKMQLLDANVIFINATLISMVGLLISYQIYRFWGETK